MEQSKKLATAVKVYLKAMGQVETANDYATLDKLRLEALAAYQEIERQVNRARPELLQICRVRRATIAQEKALQRGNSITRLIATQDALAVHAQETPKEGKTKKVKKAKE